MQSMAVHGRLMHRAAVTYRRDRQSFRRREDDRQKREYRLSVVSLSVRRVRFARFVDRAIREAQARGMSTADIIKATTVGSATFYRWRKGEWRGDPQQAQVRAFCRGLGLSLDEAYRALDWQTNDRPAGLPEPIEHPGLRELARRLADPSTPPEDRAMIEEWVRLMNARLNAGRRQVDR
jgi:hypothetical protein